LLIATGMLIFFSRANNLDCERSPRRCEAISLCVADEKLSVFLHFERGIAAKLSRQAGETFSKLVRMKATVRSECSEAAKAN
jgi:hypothetical protein